MLAGRDSFFNHLTVQLVGGSNNDNIDVRVGDNCFIIGCQLGLIDAQLLADCLELVRIGVANTADFGSASNGSFQMGLAHAKADNAYYKFFFFHWIRPLFQNMIFKLT